jgi:16S rRNA (adenine1518-N6/adenine1519-N6)-dimethyltransferase
MKAIKMLGQNFLVDNNVIDRIIDLVAPAPGDHILEVGPGQGALTRGLAASGARVLAVELDRRLAPMLSREFEKYPLIEVVEADILKIDLRKELSRYPGSRWKVAANLPYNISSQVLIKFLETPTLFTDLYLMLQKEVGDRLAAQPSCKEYGVLSVLLRLHFDIKREFIVKPEYDPTVEDYLRPVFQQQYTMSFENYPVEIERLKRPEQITLRPKPE